MLCVLSTVQYAMRTIQSHRADRQTSPNIGPDFCSRYFDFFARHVRTDEETHCYSVNVAHIFSFRHTKIHFHFTRQSDNGNVCTQAI